MQKKLQNQIKIVNFKKILIILLLGLSSTSLQVSASTVAHSSVNLSLSEMMQEKKINLNLKDKLITDILSEIRRQSGIGFIIHEDVNPKNMGLFSINVSGSTVKNALDILLKNTPYQYEVTDKEVIIKNKPQPQKKVIRETLSVRGLIVDSDKKPIPGAMVLIKSTTMGTIADGNGAFILNTAAGDVLEFSHMGFKSKEMNIKKDTRDLLIQLEQDVMGIDDVTVVAFGSQKKESVVSAITTIKPGDLKSSNSDLTSSFAGKIAGMIGWQTGGMPGALTESEMNTKFYIRGITSFQSGANIDPLILLDGVEASKVDLARISPEDIETFSVLKDASATAMYGARGANGVILVATKKGKEGSVYTTFRYEAITSMPTNEIDVVDPLTYMSMYNRALLSRDPSATPKYSVERINRTGSDKYPSWVYPTNDWYDTLFKELSINHHFGLNIRGGSKVVQYYASVNHNRDQGMIKTDRLNQFDCNVKNSTTSFRLNMNIDLKAGIKLVLNSSSSLDKNRGPRQSVQNAYALAFNASPVDYAATYPGDDTYNWPHIRFGTLSGQQNPYAKIHEGYTERNRYATINRVEYIQDLGKLAKGLEVRASVSLNQNGLFGIGYSINPFMYELEKYDFETGKHTLRATNPGAARRTLILDSRSLTSQTSTSLSYEGRVLHTAAWGGADKTLHQTSLTGVVMAQDQSYSNPSSVLDGFPNRNLSISMRGTYGYKDRYFAEASFGYNGSERFAKKNKMGFFPAGGVAWVISKEKFMKPLANTISFLKLRASYGRVGNDGIISRPRFVYLPTIGGTSVKDPEPNTFGMTRYLIEAYANNGIQWEVAESVNFGLETKLFGDLVEINLDAYQEVRHNIIDLRTTIPASMGIEVPPLDNIGKALSRGIDFSGKIQHAFSSDLWVILNGTLTYNRATYKEIEESSNKPEWQRRKGHDISQQIGYISEGLFRDQAEIDNAPVQGGNLMPGDIRYRDLNGDGVIDVNDATYIGHPETPSLIYGINGFINYKNFEFSFAFQGSGSRSFFMDPRQISPFDGGKAMLKAIHDDHWSEDNMSNKPFWPRLSTYNLTHHNPQEYWRKPQETETRKSTYFMREAKFIRCTSMELGYNLPRHILQKLRMQNVKLFVRANNPFIISNFNVWDVELGESGFNYPIQKTYSIGLNVSF